MFWCDLNPADTVAESGEGVLYQIVQADDARVEAFNKLIVSYVVPVFGTTNMCEFNLKDPENTLPYRHRGGLVATFKLEEAVRPCSGHGGKVVMNWECLD